MIATYNRLRFPEPIPIPSEDRVSAAAGLVASINEPVFGVYRLGTLTEKVGYLFYELAKQHIFVNGNKRIATYFLLRMLEMHGFSLNIQPDSLANFAEWVAGTRPEDRNAVLARIYERIDAGIGPAEGWPEAEDLYERRRETTKRKRHWPFSPE